MNHIPPGFASVTPYLHVKDASGFLEFLQQAFGAEVTMDHREGGAIVHAELRIAGSVLEVSEARTEWPPTRSAWRTSVTRARS